MTLKSYTAENKTNTAERTVESVISTASRDREGDTIAPGGWQLREFRKNPTVLFAHDYRGLPIGRARSVAVTGDKLVAVTEFAPREINPLADTVFAMYQHRFMRAWSVGFLPTKWEHRDDGVDFLEQTLLEYSAVPVPSNPEALSAAKSAGVDVAPVKAWAESVLDSCHGGEVGCWIPRKALEETYWAASSRRSYPTGGASFGDIGDEFHKNLEEIRQAAVPDLREAFEGMTDEEREEVVRNGVRAAVREAMASDEVVRQLAARTGRLPR